MKASLKKRTEQASLNALWRVVARTDEQNKSPAVTHAEAEIIRRAQSHFYTGLTFIAPKPN